MSPHPYRVGDQAKCFPRVSGDEPVALFQAFPPFSFSRVSGDEPEMQFIRSKQTSFSPRERG